MMLVRSPSRYAAVAILLVTMLGSSGFVFAERRQQWDRIVRSEQEAFRLKRVEDRITNVDEKRKARQRRVTAFESAWVLLSDFMVKWLHDEDSVEYLNHFFRLSVYAQHADWNDAREFFLWCRGHPRIDDVNAQWNGRALRGEVEARLGTLAPFRRRREEKPTPDSGYVIVRHNSQKQAISGSTLSPVETIAYNDSHRPLTSAEAARIALRRSPVSGSRNALERASTLLRESGLAFAARPHAGLIVFAVGDEARQRITALRRLVEDRDQLRREYFDSSNPSRLLYVFVNVGNGGETDGRRLSNALHARELHGLEGYFEPLDNSIVLRKNIYVQGTWYLGTALHELVHALLREEFPAAPEWLDEGLAALQEARSDDGRPVDNYRLFYVYEALDKNKLPTLQELLDSGSEAWRNSQARLMDATARYFCLFLSNRNSRTNELKIVYRRLRDDGVTSEAALTDLTHMSLAELDAEFRAFISSRPRTVPHAFDSERWSAAMEHARTYIDRL